MSKTYSKASCDYFKPYKSDAYYLKKDKEARKANKYKKSNKYNY